MRPDSVARQAAGIANEWLEAHGYSDPVRQIRVEIRPHQREFRVVVEEESMVEYGERLYHGASSRPVARFTLPSSSVPSSKALATRVVARLPKALGYGSGGALRL